MVDLGILWLFSSADGGVWSMLEELGQEVCFFSLFFCYDYFSNRFFCGFRLGDPFSPLLSVFVVEALSIMYYASFQGFTLRFQTLISCIYRARMIQSFFCECGCGASGGFEYVKIFWFESVSGSHITTQVRDFIMMDQSLVNLLLHLSVAKQVVFDLLIWVCSCVVVSLQSPVGTSSLAFWSEVFQLEQVFFFGGRITLIKWALASLPGYFFSIIIKQFNVNFCGMKMKIIGNYI